MQHALGSCTHRCSSSSVSSRPRRPLRCAALLSGWPWGGGRQAAAALRGGSLVKPRDYLDLGGLRVSPMGLGTWQWGNKFLWGYDPSMDDELQQLFNACVDAGVNLFDTADSYGTGLLNGRSEELLGRFIREYPGSRSGAAPELHVATKLAAYPWRVTPRNMVAALKGSLRRTGLEQISLGQLHWSAANYAPLQEWALWNGLADGYLEGLIKVVGVSNFGPKELRRVARDFQRRGVPLASAQVQFSLLSCGPLQAEVQAVAEDLGVTLISYSPLGLGLLSGKYSLESGRLPAQPARAALFRQLLPGIAPLLAALKAVAQGRRKTMSQVAINWAMCKNTLPIPGARTLAQAQENLGALGWRLSAGEVAELDAAAKRSTGRMVQNIFSTR